MIRLVLHVWRQDGPGAPGRFERYEATGVEPDMSFLEMLDVVNERLILEGRDPISFESDCREGICGSCGFMVDGVAHGPGRGAAICQVHMRQFRDGEELRLEPWRARAFPVLKDLVVDRSALDRIVSAGGYVSVPTGSAPEANTLPVSKPQAELSLDAAICIGCGACVAACPNASASLFAGAKVAHLGRLPQGQPERHARARGIVKAMDAEGLGHCTFIGECSAACPKSIPIEVIGFMQGDFIRASWSRRRWRPGIAGGPWFRGGSGPVGDPGSSEGEEG